MSRRILSICLKFSPLFAVLGVLGFVYFLISDKFSLQIVFAALFAIAFLVFIISFIANQKLNRKLKQRWSRYASLTTCQIDYKKELETVRGNYSLCQDPHKNIIERPNFAGAKAYCDTSVLKTGAIYYGCLVMANSALFSNRNSANKVLPAVIIYSEDEYYQENTADLQNIAKDLYNNSEYNFLSNQGQFFANTKVESALTKGRIVYATTIMAYRYHLPFACLISPHAIVPIIASPTTCQSAFIVDSQFWTDSIVADYMGLNITDDSSTNSVDTAEIFEDTSTEN